MDETPTAMKAQEHAHHQRTRRRRLVAAMLWTMILIGLSLLWAQMRAG